MTNSIGGVAWTEQTDQTLPVGLWGLDDDEAGGRDA